MPFLPFAQLFFSISIMFGTWIIYIPQIIEKLHMSKGQLGTALMFSAIGALFGNPLGKSLVNKFGPGKMSLLGISIQSLFIIGFFVAPSTFWLSTFLFFFGFFGGISQIAINTLITLVEQKLKISIMSTCHGFWSLGGIISSGLGTVLLIAIGNPFIHILVSASMVLILQLIFIKKYINFEGHVVNKQIDNSNKVYKNLLIWGMALIGLCVMVSEGAIADWSALYLRDVAFTKSELLGLGYAGFSLSMTIGRFIGDYFSKQMGSWQIIIVAYIIGSIGFVFVLFASPILSILGFFIVGLGFSIIVPEVYRLSANIDGVSPSTGIAVMSGAGNIGFLAGPVLMGAVAENYGLKISFMGVLTLVIIGTSLSIFIWMKLKAKYSMA